ncbi:uncharacterized protein N7459_001075 [Penicillium hispanicum]|uniref:uncharacterized protein n=1 Tax=Penicillium hispanicum TaxID=1080232 RepID=UPI002541E0AE|nr:uncharacterized protein N7459_001075 [Penicillium hispanicum]KAJ5594867.1 hypothetical protein N7459_001075 [Penicillium hispanicum]
MVKTKNPPGSAGGYAADLRQEISCCICRELYPAAFYSKGQLHELRKAVHAQGFSILARQQVAKCFSCSSGQSVERRCRICKHWKAIDLFSRNQRNLAMPVRISWRTTL